MTVRDNVGLRPDDPQAAQGRDQGARSTTCSRSSASTASRHRYPAQLSGGQRQRMALARALAVDPQVLLLDEPFGALDAKVREDLRHWLRRLHDEVHVTTVLVTHDQEEALDVADRIAVLNKGRIEQVGDPGRRSTSARPTTSSCRSSARWPRSAASWCARTTSCSAATATGGAGARRRAPRIARRRRGHHRTRRAARLRGAGRAAQPTRRAVRRADHPRRGRGAAAPRGRDRLRPAVGRSSVVDVEPAPASPPEAGHPCGRHRANTTAPWTSRPGSTTPSGQCYPRGGRDARARAR